MTVGKTDPNYKATLAAVRAPARRSAAPTRPPAPPYATGYAGLPVELEALQAQLLIEVEESKHVTSWLQSTAINLKKLANAAERLSDGLEPDRGGGKNSPPEPTRLRPRGAQPR